MAFPADDENLIMYHERRVGIGPMTRPATWFSRQGAKVPMPNDAALIKGNKRLECPSTARGFCCASSGSPRRSAT